MRTLLSPAPAYPVMIVENDVFIPDFQVTLRNVDFNGAVEFIHSNLRQRKLDNAYYPFPSSPHSVQAYLPEGVLMMAPTEGWDNPGPLAQEEEE